VIGTDIAHQILDFGARMKGSPQRAEEQLHGAVALHNLLQQHGVAYLADEVGMGKTLVALGAVALFRHFNPGFRVLFIAPRENIQTKWQKEFRNFAGSNVRFADLRVRGFGGQPARPLVHCDGLLSLLRETALDPDRDFFARLTSFSLPLGREEESWTKLRDHVQQQLPWLASSALDARSKDNLARALCCALPVFDLVVVDEAHNLKHGFADRVAARNRVLALAFGHPRGTAQEDVFKTYGSRARRVLFLSATPVEETYEQLWNQLDVFGRGDEFSDLRRKDVSEEEKKRVAAKFLVRRVTALKIAGEELTKNQYRREWRRGGVREFDEPIRIDDARQRLTVALVQKKVTELLGSERFGNRFQIGMLASFESFLETAKLKKQDDAVSNFDDADQSESADEREGIDVRDINSLARSHFQTFGRQMPHPKMDALVTRLATAWQTGRKALVFVRRVASVKELKAKLDETYDEYLIGRLRLELPADARRQLERVIERYEKERRDLADMATDEHADTFFAWFFRGEGPRGIVSGAAVARRFINQGTQLSTFFEDNHAAALLDVRPGQVIAALARVVGRSEDEVRVEIHRRTARLLGGSGRLRRAQKFLAAQAAAIQLLHDVDSPVRSRAQVVWAERFHTNVRGNRIAPEDIADALEWATFFSELRARPDLRAVLWPESPGDDAAFRAAFREREQRAALLGRAARLGHAFIDLYVLLIQRLGTLELGAVEDDEDGAGDRGQIDAYLDLLEQQKRLAERGAGSWGAYHELADLAVNFELVVDLNLPDAKTGALSELNREAGQLLGDQQPVGGMAGQVNQTLVRQFRMPGYPLVLVTTDLLQEGEDLHAFCSDVYHYGISWTPSAMEQRIGRIDRVRSQTERRLTSRAAAPHGDHLLQVFFPHLEDTVEVLQVRKVLGRMNTFLRLMHEGLQAPVLEDRRLDVRREMLDGETALERITKKLTSAFPIAPGLLNGKRKATAVSPGLDSVALERFGRLRALASPSLAVRWEEPSAGESPGILLGTGILEGRQQPFGLYLRAHRGLLVVRCISPIGQVRPAETADAIKRIARELRARVCAVEDEDRTYDLTVEEDVLLGLEPHDAPRVLSMLRRVLTQADEIERRFLQVDEPLKTFASDLRDEYGGPHD
jgi:hypothetical protein